ncbi:Protein kinase-like (PK-like) [Glarea lozoyensis ATCC 20868]|uniref:non-specific serine/threonine protein kinase n=1 Tax=Glarea lozoyensis (strain ATCC 20868 / MF5171) TaxID=1116229 RepID=S3CS58_GLAL2|nr:Protein kinase-like (PK-like) [Glarea lozoyensis ATCC 20868]EPE29262.1 Protein kinase-like (PK-like) [Glarea lozoyensis ATCC 20868]
MSTLLKRARVISPRKPLLPLRFPKTGFHVVSDDLALDEEHYEGFHRGHYFPVNIGDVFKSKYQVLGKLGCGETSTVWLARDLEAHSHVTLKVYTRDGNPQDEFQIYQRLSKGNHSHPGYSHVRTALETFTIPRLGGDHTCLVQKPMWESWEDLTYRISDGIFTEELLKGSLKHLFLALDYLHTECQVVHTDIKADNVLQQIKDQSILDDFTKGEMEHPSPRKIVDDMTIYASRQLGVPRYFGRAVLSDFGSAVRGDKKRNHNAGPQIYRAPEVMVKAALSYPVDIWNVGVMVWDLFEDRHLFRGDDPDGKGYSTRAHLAEVISMLGPPPLDLLERGTRTAEFFDKEGKWISEMPVPQGTSLEESEIRLQGRNKEVFLDLMRGMLQWRPEDSEAVARTSLDNSDHRVTSKHTRSKETSYLYWLCFSGIQVNLVLNLTA